jgi:hypothetical protein
MSEQIQQFPVRMNGHVLLVKQGKTKTRSLHFEDHFAFLRFSATTKCFLCLCLILSSSVLQSIVTCRRKTRMLLETWKYVHGCWQLLYFQR